ncbi:hypothetical protein E4A48_07685 [Xanthomonas cerealis pv. cerealis]|uniref:Uncharacterized protein n=1 Tax=Xanthomonas cerealis pv. cerealis TaxID=152263 RepID=A0A514EC40_9XANT|nr:hypothetical protein [Xanthomonas translucens]QDI03597.1 hypothetical protein E4A48_07685 [Xanthomonas translucens pv. cerealis]
MVGRQARRRDALTNGGGQPACLRDADGTLCFPLISGFAQIDPLALGLRRAQAPPVRIQSLDVGGHSVPLTAELHLPPHSHDIEVGFTAINLRQPALRVAAMERQHIEPP